MSDDINAVLTTAVNYTGSSIIYTCPECGGDLEETVLTSLPPQYHFSCRKCGWSHTKKSKCPEPKRIPFGSDAFTSDPESPLPPTINLC